jgi:hypothetical protein
VNQINGGKESEKTARMVGYNQDLRSCVGIISMFVVTRKPRENSVRDYTKRKHLFSKPE